MLPSDVCYDYEMLQCDIAPLLVVHREMMQMMPWSQHVTYCCMLNCYCFPCSYLYFSPCFCLALYLSFCRLVFFPLEGMAFLLQGFCSEIQTQNETYFLGSIVEIFHLRTLKVGLWWLVGVCLTRKPRQSGPLYQLYQILIEWQPSVLVKFCLCLIYFLPTAPTW